MDDTARDDSMDEGTLPLHLMLPRVPRLLLLVVAPAAFSALLYLSLTAAQLACLVVCAAATGAGVGMVLAHVRQRGLLAWLSPSARTMLLETTLLEFSLDDSFLKSMKKFVALFANPTVGELQELLRSYSPRARQVLLQRGGLSKLLPRFLQSWLHPSLACANSEDVVSRLDELISCNNGDDNRGGNKEDASGSSVEALRASDLVSAAMTAGDKSKSVKVSDLVVAATQKGGGRAAAAPPTTGDILMGQFQSSFWKSLRRSLDPMQLRRAGSIAFFLLMLLLSRSRSLRKTSSHLLRFALASSLGTVSLLAAIGTLMLKRDAAASPPPSNTQGGSALVSRTTESNEPIIGSEDAPLRGFPAAKRIILLLREAKRRSNAKNIR